MQFKVTIEMIQKAVTKSKCIQLSQDKLKIARMEPLPQVDDTDGTFLISSIDSNVSLTFET